MLETLFVRNYKNIDGLELKGLKRVNLISGKNNSGKSSLLEAIALYVSRGRNDVLLRIFEERGELDITKEAPTDIISSLFTNRDFSFSSTVEIRIGEDKAKVNNDDHNEDVLYMGLGQMTAEETIETYEKYAEPIGIADAFEVKFGTYRMPFRLGYGSFVDKLKRKHFLVEETKGVGTLQIVGTKLSAAEKAEFWDQVALTDQEKYVIEALQIIEPRIERLTFVGEGQKRIPVVRLKGEEQILPLRSMGDGINRILSIILAMVNAEGGYFLLDEFENGLHYSVQTALWKAIFHLAEKLNIQVFATTHSWDCIESFSEVLEALDTDEGNLIRLDRKDGKVQAVYFDRSELHTATRRNIEIR